MKTFSDYFGKTLHFVQPSIWKRAFELKDGEQVIGTLTYPKVFSIGVEVKIFDKKWEFYQPTWWKRLISIREAGKELPFASYKPLGFKKKTKLELPHGESVFLCSNFFKTTYEIQDRYESRLVLFKNKMSMKTKTEIQIEKRSELMDNYPWILLLMLYVELNSKKRRSS